MASGISFAGSGLGAVMEGALMQVPTWAACREDLHINRILLLEGILVEYICRAKFRGCKNLHDTEKPGFPITMKRRWGCLVLAELCCGIPPSNSENLGLPPGVPTT